MVELYPRKKSKKPMLFLVLFVALVIVSIVYYLTHNKNSSESGVDNLETVTPENQPDDEEEATVNSVDQIEQTLKDSQDSFSALEDDLKNIEVYQAENDSAPSI